MKDFTGRTAVITGAASGIGLALAHQAAARGMDLVLADVEATALAAGAEALSGNGVRVETAVCDVSRTDDVERLAETAYDAFGRVDLLCNNAGVVKRARLWELTDDDWQWVLGVDLMGVAHGVRAFVPRMLEQPTDSHILNTASISGVLPVPNLGAYGVAKSGVVALAETLQLELERAEAPIGVSVLVPGFIGTRITESDRNRPDHLADAAAPPDQPRTVAGVEPRMTADDVAARCFADVAEGRFWILTHEDYQPVIEQRVRGISRGDRPRPAPIW